MHLYICVIGKGSDCLPVGHEVTLGCRQAACLFVSGRRWLSLVTLSLSPFCLVAVVDVVDASVVIVVGC